MRLILTDEDGMLLDRWDESDEDVLEALAEVAPPVTAELIRVALNVYKKGL